MENLQRRPSGINVARLTVPERLRQLAGKRELIASTGTTNLHVAKLVAATVLARWRQHLYQLERAAARGHMDDETILKIAHGHPPQSSCLRSRVMLTSAEDRRTPAKAHSRAREFIAKLCAPTVLAH